MNAWKPAPPKINGDLHKRVNRIAHAAALKHEIYTRTSLLAILQKRAEDGARLAELVQCLDRYEAEL